MDTPLPLDPLWRLPSRRTLHLPATRIARWLRLREGQLWITADGRADRPTPEDWWLTPGQSLRVPAGTPVLAESWGAATFELLEEPAAA